MVILNMKWNDGWITHKWCDNYFKLVLGHKSFQKPIIFIIFISCFLQFFPESFSLFSLVSFPNEECTTTMTTLITGAPVRWVSSILFSSFCWKVGKTDQCECVKRDNWNLFFCTMLALIMFCFNRMKTLTNLPLLSDCITQERNQCNFCAHHLNSNIIEGDEMKQMVFFLFSEIFVETNSHTGCLIVKSAK